MSDSDDEVRLAAIEQFRNARMRAKLEQIRASFTGKSADLLSYEDVREKVRAKETNKRKLEVIPLEAIVGSVGRYRDFTRHFLPLVLEDEYRWARVHSLSEGMVGLPPIELFQIGDVYFVRDGNHRVSVARDFGAATIEAYVTQVETPISLTPDIQPDDLITKERYAHFLDRTHLDKAYPDLDMTMSVAGNYRVLEQQIKVHRRWLKSKNHDKLPFPAAAADWYETLYLPVIQMIRDSGIMRDFPDRTETDLFVWLHKHRHEVADRLGWTMDVETALLDLADEQAHRPGPGLKQLGQKLRGAITPDALAGGPDTGEWRASWLSTYREDRLFSHILVALDGQPAGWHALEQALVVAQREEGKIFGLHVVETPAATDSAAGQALRAEFDRRCHTAGIPAELSITTGPATDVICSRARWADLVVVSLSHPPGPQPVDRLGSQFSQLLRRCPRPVLAVPGISAATERMLLAYDGQPKAAEAMHVAAYLAGQWGAPLTVVVALGKRVSETTAQAVQTYMEGHDVAADYVVAPGPAAPLILKTAREQDCGLILMGGYGLRPVMEIIVGSVVDEVLRHRGHPVLICR